MRAAPILATVGLVPLILTPHLLFYYDVTPKIAVLLVGVCVALLLRSIDVGLLWRSPASRWFVCILGFQLFWFALSTAFSSNRPLSLNGSTWRRDGLIAQTGVLAFAVLCLEWLLEKPENLRLLLRVVATTGALISVYTIAQYFGVDPLLPAKAYQYGDGPFTIVRPPGTLGHADYLAAWLLFVVFCSPIWTVPLTAFALVLTGARSALLGLVVGFVLLWFLRYRRNGIKPLVGAAAFLALVVAFAVSPAGTKLRARIHWSTDDFRGGARLLLWRDSMPIVAQHPVAGLGPETFVMQFPLYQSLDLARVYPDFLHESPHNFLIDLAAGQGLPAAIALLALCGLAFRSGIRSQSPLAPSLLAALAALFVAHLFIVFTVPTELAFYLIIAMLVGVDGAAKKTIAASTSRRFVLWQYALAAFLLVFTVRSVAADYLLARAQQRITDGDVTGAANAYHASLFWQPAGTGADLSYSRQMQNLSAQSPVFRTRLDALQQAFESGVRATEESEQRQNAWYNLAELFAARNDAPNTERSLRNAIGWSPNWFKPHWILAQLLETQHRLPEASLEAQAAVERDGGQNAEVSQTWMRIQNASSNR